MLRYLALLVIYLLFALVLSLPATIPEAPDVEQRIEQNYKTKPATIEGLIAKYANEYEVDVNTAIRIANCESNMGLNLINQNSTAKGIYQFIDSTWSAYCSGDVLNTEANIDCFMRLYPIHPEYWSCV